jgi:hypothetical protein
VHLDAAVRLVPDRVVITSNLMFSEWGRIFKNPMTTAAAIDRLVHHVVILEFDVSSDRTHANEQSRHEDHQQQSQTERSRSGQKSPEADDDQPPEGR